MLYEVITATPVASDTTAAAAVAPQAGDPGVPTAETRLPAPLPEEEPLFVDEETLQQPVSEPVATASVQHPEALQAADIYPEEDLYAAPAPQASLKIEPVQLSPAQQAALDKRLARQAMASGDLANAREALDRVVRATPMDHESREQLAGLLYGEGRLSEARQLLEQGMALAPNYANFRLLLARLAQAMGDKPGALAYLQGLIV